MSFKNVVFIKSAVKSKDFPSYNHPEFAFLGRSNVGKSSLINMICNRKDLVKTGQKPGMTRLVNFFLADEKTSLVDLPGFGYAKVSKDMRNTFMPMIKNYIESRENLKLVFLLIDIRRIPGDFEDEIVDFLISKEIPVLLTLTKCDKLSKNKRQKAVKDIMKKLEVEADALFYTSAQNGEGKKDIHKIIREYAAH